MATLPVLASVLPVGTQPVSPSVQEEKLSSRVVDEANDRKGKWHPHWHQVWAMRLTCMMTEEGFADKKPTSPNLSTSPERKRRDHSLPPIARARRGAVTKQETGDWVVQRMYACLEHSHKKPHSDSIKNKPA